jgi:hypothetical protein
MSRSTSEITIDTIYDRLPPCNSLRQNWAVSLGTATWRKDLLVLWSEEEEEGWKPNGKIDHIRRSSGGDRCWILTSSQGQCVIWELETHRFVHKNVKCFVDKDVDKVIYSLKQSGDLTTTLDILVSYVTNRHDLSSALKACKKHLRAMFPREFGGEPQHSQGEVGGSAGGSGRKRKRPLGGPFTSLRVVPDSLRSERPAPATTAQPGVPTRPRSSGAGTQSASATTGSGARRADDPRSITPSGGVGSTAAAGRPGPVLERVRTHIEAVRGVSQEERTRYQDDLISKYAVQEETIIVDISTLIPPVREGQGVLPDWQIRPVSKWFVAQLREKMETVGVSKVVGPFLLMVDPAMCSRREDFKFEKKNEYRYRVLGGNHSACARADLTAAKPDHSGYRRCQSWIFVGLDTKDARMLAWTHNIDNEFRSNLSLIQKLNYIHLKFVENEYKATVELKKECAQEIQLKDWGRKDDATVLNANDNMF